MGTRNILVRVGFGFGSLDTKILNSFGYLINFGSDSVLLFQLGFGSVFRIRFFCPALIILVDLPERCISIIFCQQKAFRSFFFTFSTLLIFINYKFHSTLIIILSSQKIMFNGGRSRNSSYRRQNYTNYIFTNSNFHQKHY